MSSEYIKLFESAQSKWLCDPYSLEIRYIARENELLACVARLWLLGSGSGHCFHLNTSQISAGREYFKDCSTEKLNTYIDQLKQGKLVLNDKTFHLKMKNGLSYYSEMISRERWFCDAHLRVIGEAIYPFSPAEISKINDELRHAAIPFDGLPDLINYLDLSDPLSGHSQSAVELRIFPPIDMRIADSNLSKEKFTLILHGHSKLNTQEIALAIRMFPEHEKSRKQLASSIKWSKEKDGTQVGKLQIQAKKTFAVLAILMVGGNTVRRQFYDDFQRLPNRRLVAVSKFDENLKMLRRGLSEVDATAFEIAVNSLAYLLGFSGSVLNETDAPDIILSSPEENLVIVECTTRIKDFSVKLNKLVDRKNALISLLAEANDSRKVYCYLVCGLPREQIAYEAKELARHKVTLLTKESLDFLLTQLKFPMDLEQMLWEDEKQLEALIQADNPLKAIAS
ncbi:MAG TPA: hypothetical protein VFF75_09350 [Methylophilaceae bacterium]|nr:hypothetical protein [Methylophilaceae bacterium]